LLGRSEADIMIAMDVTVQWVRTSWTKRSRGAPHADARNRAPVAFVLPPGPSPLVHEVLMQESDDFRPRFEVTDTLPAKTRLRLRERGEALTVQVGIGFGAPCRGYRPSVTIRPGEWLRWQMNKRSSSFAGMGDWHYELQTVNIAFGPVRPDAFLGRPPHLVDELAALR
jgi:hypothetical protein